MPDNESLFFQTTTAAALFGSGCCCCCFGRCEIFFFPILRRLRTSSFSAPPSRTNQHKRAHKTSCVFLFIPISSRSKSTHNILLIYFCVLVHFCVHFQTIPTTSRGNSAAVFFMDLNFRLGRKTKPGTVSLFSGLIPKNDTPILSQVGTLRLQGNNE